LAYETRKSVLTAARTATLAAELGIPHVLAVGNKARTPEDVEFFASALAAEGIELAGVLSFDAQVAADDRAGTVGLSPIGTDTQGRLDSILEAVDTAVGRSGVDNV
jgi:CO dehydrogenase maturation factor